MTIQLFICITNYNVPYKHSMGVKNHFKTHCYKNSLMYQHFDKLFNFSYH